MRVWFRLCLILLVTPTFSQSELVAEQIEQDGESIDESWPKKSQNKNSSFFRKMKAVPSLSVKMHPQKNVSQPLSVQIPLGRPSLQGSSVGWQDKESSWNAKNPWDCSDDKAKTFKPNDRFQAENSFLAMEREKRSKNFTESARVPNSPVWSSRRSRLGQNSVGGLQFYEGRLKRVRESFWHQEENPSRDLGQGKKESLTPEEVETLLQRPSLGVPDPASGHSSEDLKEQSRSESQPAGGGN